MISRPSLQPLWMQLLKLSHAGMNYGGGHEVAWSGEIEALAFAARSIGSRKGMTLFDVGANNGEYFRAALKILGDDARVFAFEPQSSCFQFLKQHGADDRRVHLRNVALGKEVTSAKLFFSEDRQPTASLYQTGPELSDSETVHVTTLDQFCLDEGIDQIDILKIDTEGNEMEVLLGASDLLRSGRIATVQFEFGNTFLQTKYHFEDLFNLLSPRYTIYRILNRGLVEVPVYSHHLEIFRVANFMCIRKKGSPPS